MTASVEASGIKVGSARRPSRDQTRRVRSSWREGALTRVQELESLSSWLSKADGATPAADLLSAIEAHLSAAREAAGCDPRRWLRYRDGALRQRAISNMDAAEANLLSLAPATYLLGQMPCLLNQVQRHLPLSDMRRREFERIAADVGLGPIEASRTGNGRPQAGTSERLALRHLREPGSGRSGGGGAGCRSRGRPLEWAVVVERATGEGLRLHRS
jgi:hypothetical protein